MNINNHITDDLITKYLCGEATPDEAMQLEEWKQISKENQLYFDNMQQSFLMVSNVEWSDPDKNAAWQKFNAKPKPSTKMGWMYGLAAILIVGLLSVVFLMNDEKMPLELIANETSVTRSLSDQSEVTLQANSKISYEDGFGTEHRQLKLTGKGKFTVTHNESLPFIIESNGVFIEDLGTLFSVESMPDSDTVYVVVNEGIVRLYDEHGSEIIIKAGEKAWYIRSQKTIITDLETKVLKFDFKDTRLVEVVDLLEKTYQIDVQLSPESIGECKITTQFFDEEVATIITVIAETLGFKYEYQDHHYKITGKPCQ
ncbi:MAG TPA: FecR domain-containing protein [Saprospiraceae bacterium]|nr:FecR domain-containing protein [Saprospiraceae bacterium]